LPDTPTHPRPARTRSSEHLEALNRRLHRVVAQLKTLYHMGHDLAQNENWSDALDRFLMMLVSFMEAEGAALLLFSENETVLAPRSSFQVDEPGLQRASGIILNGWKRHPRSSEIHSLESYGENQAPRHSSCLEHATPWRSTVIPLRHRNKSLGFLLMEKEYRSGRHFTADFDFLNTLQTIFAEEIANASYISELRQLSRFNNKVLDNIRSGVISTDLDGNVRYANVWASDMCPRLREVERVPVRFDALFRCRQFPGEFFESILRSEQGSYLLEVECDSGDGAFPARLRTTKMYDDNLNGMVVVAIFEDLTEQRRMEAEIRRNDRLRVLGQMSAGVAHEIRNPLTGIATTAEVLAVKVSGDQDKERYLRTMLEEINRLDDIIRNLLEFARPPKPQIAPCSLGGVTERVQGLISSQAGHKGVAVSFEAPRADVMCYADAGQLTQVLLNVVLNAVQACGPGDEVKVACRVDEPDTPGAGQVARIDVIDNGPGVPPQIRDSLFDPFVTTKTRGTGLGLAICQHIIEEHEGTIGCEFLEQGTHFSIELPYARERAPRRDT
jgi:signal transduction histidine kinase